MRIINVTFADLIENFIYIMLSYIYLFFLLTRGTGPMKTTMDVIKGAEVGFSKESDNYLS